MEQHHQQRRHPHCCLTLAGFTNGLTAYDGSASGLLGTSTLFANQTSGYESWFATAVTGN